LIILNGPTGKPTTGSKRKRGIKKHSVLAGLKIIKRSTEIDEFDEK